MPIVSCEPLSIHTCTHGADQASFLLALGRAWVGVHGAKGCTAVSSHVTFPNSSAFTASCNDRRCTDAVPATGSPTQFHAPTQRREGRECASHDCGAVRMCACHGLEQGARTQRLQTPSSCRVQYSVSLGTGSLGLRDRSAIPVSVPGPVWLSTTGQRACPRVRRRAHNQHTPSAPPQGGHSQLSSHTHTCDVNHSTSLRYPGAACGVAPLIDRERRVGCSMDSSCELLSSL